MTRRKANQMVLLCINGLYHSEVKISLLKVWCIYCKPTLYFLDYDWFSIRVHAVHGHGACLASPKGKVYFHDFSNLATQAMGQIIIEKNRMDAKREMHAVSWPKYLLNKIMDKHLKWQISTPKLLLHLSLLSIKIKQNQSVFLIDNCTTILSSCR